jgi:two-component system, OmpR family, phosphate regulon sensor histidine kinase PhoR
MTVSLRWKVALGGLLAVGLGFLIAGWLALHSIERLELARVADDLETRTSVAILPLLPLLTQRPQAGLDLTLLHTAREIGRQAAARVTVISPTGVVLADSETADAAVERLENHRDRPEVTQALVTGRGSDLRTSRTTGERLFYLAVRVPRSTEPQRPPIAIVRLAVPLTMLETQLQELQQALGIAFGIAFLAAIAISILVTRSLTRPLLEIVGVARRLAEGALEQRLQTRSRDEVGVLATTLNQMAEQLELKIREVSEDRAQLVAMLVAMLEGVMVLDCVGKVLQVNPALERMFRLHGREARGRWHSELIRHQQLTDLIQEVLDLRQNRNGEIMLPTGRTLRVEAAVAGGSRENEACAVLVFHDVTELRRLEKVRKDFVANVSHELRTPLTSIKGYVEALLDGAKDHPEEAGRFLDIILKQSDRLNLILEDLLQLSQIESGQVRFKREPVTLQAIVERTLPLIKPLAEKKGHQLGVHLAPELPPVMGDEERLVQVLTNLLDNAVKYTPAHGSIEIRGRSIQDDGHPAVELSVVDSGIGIPESDRPRVFERFYRVDKARSRELGGTGLGLAIVKHIVVEGHGGRIWVEGNQPTGSRFILRLPSASPESH